MFESVEVQGGGEVLDIERGDGPVEVVGSDGLEFEDGEGVEGAGVDIGDGEKGAGRGEGECVGRDEHFGCFGEEAIEVEDESPEVVGRCLVVV